MSERKNKEPNSNYVSKRNVLDDLGFSTEISAVVKMKSDL